jgi:hypothetical protein
MLQKLGRFIAWVFGSQPLEAAPKCSDCDGRGRHYEGCPHYVKRFRTIRHRGYVEVVEAPDPGSPPKGPSATVNWRSAPAKKKAAARRAQSPAAKRKNTRKKSPARKR